MRGQGNRKAFEKEVDGFTPPPCILFYYQKNAILIDLSKVKSLLIECIANRFVIQCILVSFILYSKTVEENKYNQIMYTFPLPNVSTVSTHAAAAPGTLTA